ncbi:hypothetical protein H310_05409 [Aphanomyces invadans]|uniref:Uncharacterized protein n=1 Tax=Aphanomyces invadans TaxID=157072 RepID=A0A024UBI4_9STRA|nr:hypothetical protein H310_05409 [Aphanomyces invadans]ETW02968.1 hypothetical protein H310_05409 [Aphanomyces invadans]RHY29707.1 hypothetical protein DYB32_004926 [Aphanomyces invadans]|eukprot:XP_008868352.1 hypothetical protein H310_05409 [Aphanomyces invadans]
MLPSSTQFLAPPHHDMDETRLMNTMRAQLSQFSQEDLLRQAAVQLPDEVKSQLRLLQTIKLHNEMLRTLVQQVDSQPTTFSYPIQDPQPTDVQTTKEILAWYFSEDNHNCNNTANCTC